MQILKQSTASQAIKLGPFVDDTDGKTAEAGLTIANTDIQISKAGGNFGNKNSGGATADGTDGWYTVTLDATDTATVGTLDVQVSVAGALPVFARFQVVEEAVYDDIFAANAAGYAGISELATVDTNVDSILADTGTDGVVIAAAQTVATVTDVTNQVTADVTAISGDSTAADNLELMYDGTGYTDDTAPASRSQFNGLTSGSAAINTVPLDSPAGFVITTGSNEANTEDSTHALDGTTHDLEDTAGTTDCYYIFSVGGNGIPVSVTWDGYVNVNGDTWSVYAYNWGTTSWEQVGTVAGANGTTVVKETFTLTTSHVGTGANLGKVHVRFYSTDGTKIATDRIVCSYAVVTQSVGYALGAIWVDTNASNTNTESYVDGVADNPVSTWAAAKTLSSQIGIKKFIVRGSITLDANSDSYNLIGYGATLALGGQSIEGATIEGFNISGTGTSTVTSPTFLNVDFGTTTVPPASFYNCGLGDTLTIGSAGDLFFVDCYSQVAGSSSPIIDMGAAVGATNLSVRRFGGGMRIDNLATGDVVSAEATVGGTLTLNGADASVEIRGGWKAVSNNLTGSPTVTDKSVNTRFDDTQGSTFNTSTDSLEAIRNRGDSAWTTGAGGTPPDLLQSTTIATLSTQTSFTLTAGSADNDAYNDQIAIITDSATSEQKATATISDYVGSTKTVTLSADPGIFTMAAGDTINIIAATGAAGSGATAAEVWGYAERVLTAGTNLNDPTAAAIADAVWDEATVGHTTAGTFGEQVKTDIDAILADTNELQTDDVPGLIAALNDISTTEVATELATYDAPTKAELDSGLAGLNDLTAAQVNAEVDAAIADALNSIADAVLNRDFSAVSDTNARTLLNAARFLRNKYSVSGSTLTVTKEDDSTSAWTSALTTDAGAEPITGSDPS